MRRSCSQCVTRSAEPESRRDTGRFLEDEIRRATERSQLETIFETRDAEAREKALDAIEHLAGPLVELRDARRPVPALLHEREEIGLGARFPLCADRCPRLGERPVTQPIGEPARTARPAERERRRSKGHRPSHRVACVAIGNVQPGRFFEVGIEAHAACGELRGFGDQRTRRLLQAREGFANVALALRALARGPVTGCGKTAAGAAQATEQTPHLLHSARPSALVLPSHAVADSPFSSERSYSAS
jgi:hypothetical protein